MARKKRKKKQRCSECGFLNTKNDDLSCPQCKIIELKSPERISAVIKVISNLLNKTNTELLERIRLRDNIKMASLALNVGILSISANQTIDYHLIISIPFVCLGLSYLIRHHNFAIIALLGYRVFDLEPIKNKLYREIGILDVPEFELSKTFHNFGLKAIRARGISHLIILVVPCFLSISITMFFFIDKNFIRGCFLDLNDFIICFSSLNGFETSFLIIWILAVGCTSWMIWNIFKVRNEQGVFLKKAGIERRKRKRKESFLNFS